MQKKLKNNLYLLAMLVGIFLNSCQNNKELGDRELAEAVNSVIKINGQSLKHVNLFFTNNEKSFSCQLDTPEQEKVFNTLKNHLGGEINNITANPYLLTIYTKNGLRDIKFDDVIGASVFVRDAKSGLLQHNLFIVEKNTTKEDKRFSVQVLSIFKDNIALMGEIVFKGMNFSVGIMSSKVPQTGNSYKPNGKIDMLDVVINKYADNSNMKPRGNCYECGGMGERCLQDQWSGDWACWDPGTPGQPQDNCKVVQVKNLSIQSGLSTSEVSSNEVLYDFRDNFMMNYSKGRNYINYYYALGRFMEEKNIINATNISQYLQFTVITCTIASKLKGGNDNEIIVTPSYKVGALQIINNLRTQAGENASVANILNTIEADLNLYVNKTRVEILNTLN